MLEIAPGHAWKATSEVFHTKDSLLEFQHGYMAFSIKAKLEEGQRAFNKVSTCPAFHLYYDQFIIDFLLYPLSNITRKFAFWYYYNLANSKSIGTSQVRPSEWELHF